jgi:hypothetical protein
LEGLWDITMWDITTWDITTWDITTWDITMWDITMWGICICKSRGSIVQPKSVGNFELLAA